jgi:microcystin degradation protein MlrC
MDLVQRALVWEAREVDVYVNVFFGFPWADVPDAGMTIQVTANGRPDRAAAIATDMAAAAWRMRQSLVSAARVLRMGEGVAAARQAVAEGRRPVVLADHSDRSGYATWLLRELIAQQAGRVLIGTIADGPTIAALLEAGVKPGDAFDREIGGGVDASAGAPVRITGLVRAVTAPAGAGIAGAGIAVSFGAGNVLVLSAYLAQVTDPRELTAIGLDAADFDFIAIKSRVHFRRGFDDSGFAGAIFLVEPDEPFLGTVRLEALPYRHLDISRFYPYGELVYDPAAEELQPVQSRPWQGAGELRPS